jgi:hypothetical protein
MPILAQKTMTACMTASPVDSGGAAFLSVYPSAGHIGIPHDEQAMLAEHRLGLTVHLLCSPAPSPQRHLYGMTLL